MESARHSNEKTRSWRAASPSKVSPIAFSQLPRACRRRRARWGSSLARAPRTRSSPQRRVARIAERRRRRAEPRESGDPRARGPGAVCRPQTVMGTAEDSPSRAMPRGFRADVPERVIPASRRPDGSMRKEIRVRAGYVNQDEVRRYTPGAFRRAREEEASRRQTPASAPIQSRDAHPQTRTQTRTGTATTRDASRSAAGAHSKPSLPAREPRTRSETRAAAAAAKSRASAWSSSDDDDDNNKDSVPASARARHPERLHRGGKGAEGVPSSRTRQASASAAETEALRESFGDLRVREARSRDGGRGRGGGRGGPRW